MVSIPRCVAQISSKIEGSIHMVSIRRGQEPGELANIIADARSELLNKHNSSNEGLVQPNIHCLRGGVSRHVNPMSTRSELQVNILETVLLENVSNFAGSSDLDGLGHPITLKVIPNKTRSSQ